MARNCPQCHTLMQPETVDQVTVDVCPKCGGIWFNEDDLRKMLSNSKSAIEDLEHNGPKVEQKAAGQSELRCPDDGALLNLHHYLYSSPAVLHTCPKCYGFFIDADQLPKMQSARSAANPSDKEAEGLAQIAGERDKVLMRSQLLQGIFGALMHDRPGWFF